MKTNVKKLTAHLDTFLDAHPQGWNDQHWRGLLAGLNEVGLGSSDPDAVGKLLEERRLHRVLSALEVRGLGPKRAETLSRTFGTLWSLGHADVDAIAAVPGIHRSLAEQVRSALTGVGA